MKSKLKKGDTVKVITGKDKGKVGIIRSVLRPKTANPGARRLVVEGVNMVSRHLKPNPQKEQPGEIIRKEAPIDISNVKRIDSAS